MKNFQQLCKDVDNAYRELIRAISGPNLALVYDADQRWQTALARLREAS
jgi:hypothetical protein